MFYIVGGRGRKKAAPSKKKSPSRTKTKRGK